MLLHIWPWEVLQNATARMWASWRLPTWRMIPSLSCQWMALLDSAWRDCAFGWNELGLAKREAIAMDVADAPHGVLYPFYWPCCRSISSAFNFLHCITAEPITEQSFGLFLPKHGFGEISFGGTSSGWKRFRTKLGTPWDWDVDPERFYCFFKMHFSILSNPFTFFQELEPLCFSRVLLDLSPDLVMPEATTPGVCLHPSLGSLSKNPPRAFGRRCGVKLQDRNQELWILWS